MTRWQPAPNPAILPPNWSKQELPDILAIGAPLGAQLMFKRSDGLIVLLDWSEKRDGRLWIHASMSFVDRLPKYADLCEVKRIFIGKDRTAIQVFAPESKHVNIHPYCLHLWSCTEGNPIPDFTFGGISI